MAAAIRDDNPVVYLHPYMLTLDKGEVPDGEYIVPLGVADIKRAGTDVTIVAVGWMVKKALAAAERLAEEGISAEVVDPRTLAPLDVTTIVNSVKKTGRVVLVDQAPRQSSAAAVIAGEIAEHALGDLHALRMVTGSRHPHSLQRTPGNYVVPNEDKIVEAVKSVMAQEAVAA